MCGTFSDWKPIPMVKSQKDFVALIDLPVGEHQVHCLAENHRSIKVRDLIASPKRYHLLLEKRIHVYKKILIRISLPIGIFAT